LSLFDHEYDFLSSRQTLGLLENESQLRFNTSKKIYYQDVNAKMSYIIKKYKPKRIWFYNNQEYLSIELWFNNNDWRLAMDSLGPLHSLKLYDSKHKE
jgi:hypothetical protein